VHHSSQPDDSPLAESVLELALLEQGAQELVAAMVVLLGRSQLACVTMGVLALCALCVQVACRILGSTVAPLGSPRVRTEVEVDIALLCKLALVEVQPEDQDLRAFESQHGLQLPWLPEISRQC